MIGDVLINAILFFALDRQHRDKERFLYMQYPQNQHNIVTFQQLPSVPPNHIRIVVIGDTHERHNGLGTLPECDIFVHCGDILMTGRFFSKKSATKKLIKFNEWLSTIPAKKKIVIAGNHDKQILLMGKEITKQILSNCEYLENEESSYGNLTIWATPLSHGKSRNKAFQSKDFHNKTLEECPKQVDILITHGHIPDVEDKVKHKIHFCGHNHNSYGVFHKTTEDGDSRLSLCTPVHDGQYKLKHLPMIIDVPCKLLEEDASNAVQFLHTAEDDESKRKAPSTRIIDLESESRTSSIRSAIDKMFGTGKSSTRIRPV